MNSATDYYPFGMVARSWSSSQQYRYGFNGQEHEDDITGGDYDFGARIYDSRIAKFLSIDPLEKKYPQWSPYLFAADNPIKFIDVLGLGPGDVVVVFGGGDIKGQNDAGGASTIVQKLTQGAIKTNGGAARAFVSKYWGVNFDDVASLDKATQAAYDFIIANHNKADGKVVEGGKVIISGYSFGGVLATHLTERLKKANIQVDLLITVDAAAGPESNSVPREIPDNVKHNINIYQTKESSIWSRGAKNSAKDPKKTVVENHDLTNETVDHGNIDDRSESSVVFFISNLLKGMDYMGKQKTKN